MAKCGSLQPKYIVVAEQLLDCSNKKPANCEMLFAGYIELVYLNQKGATGQVLLW